MRACAFEGCPREARARGWCTKHYQRWKRHGDPAVVLPSGWHAGVEARWTADPRPLLARFHGKPAHVIAARCGVDRCTVQRWRAGRRVGNPDRVACRLGLWVGEIWPEQYASLDHEAA